MMTSYGKVETEILKQNLESQLDRLVLQLDDLETCRDELDASEYEETKQDTIEQLKEFKNSLDRLVKGDMSLVDSLGAMQLATQAAISQAFQTPEVIRLFGRREPKLLKEKLNNIDQELKLGKISSDLHNKQKAEILTALRQLGEQLSPTELQFLEHQSSDLSSLKNIQFQQVNEDDNN